MPFDPNIPADHAELTGVMFRGQFTGLKALIDALSSINAAQVDGVTTLNPGENASVTLSVVGSTLHFSFSIPRGNDGGPGPQGQQGPPFANAVVDTVNTVDPGQPAGVQVGFDGANVHFTFNIPRGNDGPQGQQGMPGEVTNAQLVGALTGTSSNSNAVGTLDTAFTNDPPTLADLEVVRAKINELIGALRR